MTQLVDGHAHFYPIYDRDDALDSASAAFSSARHRKGLGLRGSNSLVVVDPAGVDGFGSLQGATATRWSMSLVSPLAINATRDSDGASLTLIAGKQTCTDNGVEVLAYFTRERLPDGLTLVESVESALDAGALPVIPWGFGKWWGKRGASVEELLKSPLGSKVLLADSSVRPNSFPEPRAFQTARQLGISILAGSDPFPFKGEEAKMARYGFVVTGGPTSGDPAQALEERLKAGDFAPGLFGVREKTHSAFRLQLAMQLRKLRRSGRSGL